MTRPAPPPTIPALGSAADRTRTDGRRDARPTPSGFGSQPEPDLLEPQIPLHVLNGAVRGISSAALALSAARTLTEGPVTARLDQALGALDDLVRELRHAALVAHLTTRAWPHPRADPAQSGTSTPTPPPISSRRPQAHPRMQTPSRSGCGATPMPTQATTPAPEKSLPNAARLVRPVKQARTATAFT
jgi:hypothetical protein